MTKSGVLLDGKTLKLDDVLDVATGRAVVQVDAAVRERLARARALVDDMTRGDEPHYGINTGFGALAEKKIPRDKLAVLQKNLIESHAVGTGEPMSVEVARGLMMLRAATLAVGHSGCRPLVLDALVALLNAGCAPCVPKKGSVGASGDLAPLAHVALLLLGQGDAFVTTAHGGTQRVSAAEALARADVTPVVLEAKEGLALINGTQAMAATGLHALVQAERLAVLADVIGALSLDALQGTKAAFDPRIHHARAHPGQLRSAANLRALLHGSEIMESHKDCDKVQDPYSLRCMPQVHGATRDTLAFVRAVLTREINSATDNPLVFLDGDYGVAGDDVLSGGNFHGQPVALALDYLAIATAELANISERRIEQLVNPALSSGLPAFLAPDPGLNSGFMILQVTAAALINENKVLCHPASVDSIPSSANREDHVSMGMTSANKAAVVVDNVTRVLGIELMTACQALDLRAPLRPGRPLQDVFARARKDIAFAPVDRAFGVDMEKAIALARTDELVALAKKQAPALA
ncbi:MAG: histidine ammonia-lyase [Deltaproteobacteria bacterium]|nr:histidine ammonia-lyase [Deltaproteobacteria bacterium]